ncbi:hypothetical protein [Rhodococcus sp. NCIMB 12038]|uniref:hypothetical protein n=1 Tax=Rhodococcus sp. NCIMB 12038 TaxID=933800 RepID=UPI0015C5C0DC|nr:hypothetical protein [Rhodococcus sp. NCIMB 12038]
MTNRSVVEVFRSGGMRTYTLAMSSGLRAPGSGLRVRELRAAPTAGTAERLTGRGVHRLGVTATAGRRIGESAGWHSGRF